MQRKHNDADIVFQVDPSMFPRRKVEKRASAPMASPQNLTVSIPTPHHSTKVKNHGHAPFTWQPPQEIFIGGGHEVAKKPPKTINVKDAFCPPSVVVIGDKHEKKADHDGVPMVIQVQEATPHTVCRSERGTDQGAPSLPRTIQPVRKKEVPAVGVIFISLTEAKSLVPALPDESAMMQPSETVLAGAELPPSTRNPNQIDDDHPRKERRPSPDPPSPKPDPIGKKLPDFSAMLAKREHAELTPRRRRKNILNNSADSLHSHSDGTDEGHGPLSNSQAYASLAHESWPAVHGRANNLRGTSTRAPQWLGVTGNAEEWIRATKPDDILEVGRKIAQHRIPEL